MRSLLRTPILQPCYNDNQASTVRWGHTEIGHILGLCGAFSLLGPFPHYWIWNVPLSGMLCISLPSQTVVFHSHCPREPISLWWSKANEDGPEGAVDTVQYDDLQ